MKYLLLPLLCLPMLLAAQHTSHPAAADSSLSIVENIDPQPLLAQALRLQEALAFLGSALSPADRQHLQQLQRQAQTPATAVQIQQLLDPYCLAMVEINPEARVKVIRGPAKASLIQGGWSSFLVKVHNEAGVTARLEPTSAHALPALHISSSAARTLPENKLSKGQVQHRFLELQLYRNRPLLPSLSGFALEYAVLQVYSKDAGQREADLGFHIGQGTQDIGFRNSIPVLFSIRPAVKVVLDIKDEDGTPAMASFTVTDGINRVRDSAAQTDYRLTLAQENYQVFSKALTGIYPLPSRRVAAYDEYPDFFFQPQVYRQDGEHIMLAPGRYTISFTRGPEYLTQTKELVIKEGVDTVRASFRLQRWINMAKMGWYSADHHVHAAGCSHYESPEEGVSPADIWRQVLGEDLNIAAVLAWGPGWYHQKQYFTGHADTLSTAGNIMRYDVEVSGFPLLPCRTPGTVTAKRR